MKRSLQLLALLGLVSALPGCGSEAHAAALEDPPAEAEDETFSISVTVKGLRNTDGAVVAYLYDAEGAFPTKFDRAAKTVKTTMLSGDRAKLKFGYVPAGTYAIVVVHDENGNGKPDKNLLGMPKEGIGASNHTKRGRPSWKKSSFTLDARKSVSINLMYM